MNISWPAATRHRLRGTSSSHFAPRGFAWAAAHTCLGMTSPNPFLIQKGGLEHRSRRVRAVARPQSGTRHNENCWALYLSLPTLRHYLILSQDFCAVEVYSRQPEKNGPAQFPTHRALSLEKRPTGTAAG